MEKIPSRDLKVGAIFEELLDVIERNAVTALIFIAVIAAINGAIAYFGVNYNSMTQELGKQFIAFLIGVVGGFLLLIAMLKQAKFIEGNVDDAFLPFVGLSIVTTIGVILGFIAIIFPGLYLMARWSLAQPLLLSKRMGVFEAIGGSWERTAGSEFSIILVVIIMMVAQVGVSFALQQSFGVDNPLGITVTQTFAAAMTVVGAAMGVALYKLLVADREGGVSKTFD